MNVIMNIWINICAVQGMHVVELGSGCGLVGLLLATLGAHVALTDLPMTMVSV